MSWYRTLSMIAAIGAAAFGLVGWWIVPAAMTVNALTAPFAYFNLFADQPREQQIMMRMFTGAVAIIVALVAWLIWSLVA